MPQTIILPAGDLRHRITLQRRVAGQDDYGQGLETWSDVLTGISAAIRPATERTGE